MSRARGLFTPLVVTLFGIGTGIATFDPAFRQEKEQREHHEQQQDIEPSSIQHAPPSSSPSPSPPTKAQLRKTTIDEETVVNARGATTTATNTRNTTIPKNSENADGGPKVQRSATRFSKPLDTFSWSDVPPLDRYSSTSDNEKEKES